MQPNTFSIGDCFSFGWKTFKTRSWFFIGTFLLVSVIDIAIRLLTSHGKDAGAFLVFADFVASVILGSLLSMGILSFTLKAHDAPMAVRIKDLWPSFDRFWKYLATVVLIVVITVVGFILVIIPGLIAMTVLAFSYYPVIERCLGPIEAMKESARLTKGHRWQIFGLIVLVIVLNIVGLILLLVGVLVTIPVTMFALVHAYRTLSGPNPMTVPASEPSTAPVAA